MAKALANNHRPHKGSIIAPVAIQNRTKRRMPALPYQAMKDAILGSQYDLSLTIVSEKEIATLNQTYRGKSGPTDILSFSLSDTAGEILIAPQSALKKAAIFRETFATYMRRLFIHGCFHLKGFAHGATMEQLERRMIRRFSKK